MIRHIVISILFSLSLYSNEVENELNSIYNILNDIHSNLKVSDNIEPNVFIDELKKSGEGNCNHFTSYLFRELLKRGYSSEVISIITYNNDIHAIIETKLKANNKKILVDPLSKIVYKNSLLEILRQPKLANTHIGTSEAKSYTKPGFFNSIRQLQYYPFIDMNIINNQKEIKSIVFNKDEFYLKNDPFLAFDYNKSSYVSGKEKKRLSSIVIYPYDDLHYPKNIVIKCDDNIIYNKRVDLIKNIIVLNFYGNNRCLDLNFKFSQFQGQNRLLLRDIYIYGK